MIKLLSLFSGIGAFEKALDNLNISYEIVNYCEFDKYASKAYSLLHNVPESKNLGDITEVDELTLPKGIDLVTYGFPCQDISIAGNQQGLFNEDGTPTRSGLFFEALKIITHTQPKIAIAENVKNLTSKRFKNQFEIVLDSLDQAGYNNYWKVLNAKDYGIPQNRERVFIISIRKDIDNKIFEFPEPYKLNKRLKDVLEDKVDEKYYLSEEMCKGFIEKTPMIGYVNQDTQASKVISEDGIFQTLCAGTHGYANGYVKVKEATKQGFAIAKPYDTINLEHPNGIAPTITVVSGGGREKKVLHNLRIRKLTPIECFRLMGFKDVDCKLLMENKLSNTQLYKQAGNSIVVDVLEEIFCQIFDSDGEIWV